MRRLLLLVFALALAGILAAPVSAHPGHDHKIMGTILSVDGKRVVMKRADGQERTFELTETTKLLNGKQKGSADDLKAGLRIVANVGDGKAPLKAKELQYTLKTAK